MSQAFCIYDKTTGRISSNKICAASDLRLKENEGALEGWFDDIEYVVATSGVGKPSAAKKPQAEIDAYRAQQSAQLAAAEASRVDPTALITEALKQKGISITAADLAAARASLQSKAGKA